MVNILLSCKQPESHPARHIDPAFYYWKSIYATTSFERKRLQELHIHTQYVKYFDIGWNEQNSKPQPLAVIRFGEGSMEELKNNKLVPVIFITNECMQHLDTSSTLTLSNQLLKLVHDIQSVNNLPEFHEIQIDCDWSTATREVYFRLLTHLRKIEPDLRISATIRLHQIKYMSKTGVPPVHKGLLMCYNMGNLRDPGTINSILDPELLKKYLGQLKTYPLPLDIALPLFSWTVLLRNENYIGLLKLNPAELPPSAVTPMQSNRFRLTKDTLIGSFLCRKNDILRYESSDWKDILRASDCISQDWKDTSGRVLFFHLDSVILQKYSHHELETILDRFR